MATFSANRDAKGVIAGEETAVQMWARTHTHHDGWDNEWRTIKNNNSTWKGELGTDCQALEGQVMAVSCTGAPGSLGRPLCLGSTGPRPHTGHLALGHSVSQGPECKS